MLLFWGRESGSGPPPEPVLAIITLGFAPGAIYNIVWFGFGPVF